MLVKELFDKFNITCPNWLETETIDDEFIDLSKYKFEDNTHKWLLKRNDEVTIITFNGKEYRYKAFDKNGVLGYTYYANGKYVVQS